MLNRLFSTRTNNQSIPMVLRVFARGHKLILSCNQAMNTAIQPSADEFQLEFQQRMVKLESAFLQQFIHQEHASIILSTDQTWEENQVVRIIYSPEVEGLQNAAKEVMRPFDKQFVVALSDHLPLEQTVPGLELAGLQIDNTYSSTLGETPRETPVEASSLQFAASEQQVSVQKSVEGKLEQHSIEEPNKTTTENIHQAIETNIATNIATANSEEHCTVKAAPVTTQESISTDTKVATAMATDAPALSDLTQAVSEMIAAANVTTASLEQTEQRQRHARSQILSETDTVETKHAGQRAHKVDPQALTEKINLVKNKQHENKTTDALTVETADEEVKAAVKQALVKQATKTSLVHEKVVNVDKQHSSDLVIAHEAVDGHKPTTQIESALAAASHITEPSSEKPQQAHTSDHAADRYNATGSTNVQQDIKPLIGAQTDDHFDQVDTPNTPETSIAREIEQQQAAAANNIETQQVMLDATTVEVDQQRIIQDSMSAFDDADTAEEKQIRLELNQSKNQIAVIGIEDLNWRHQPKLSDFEVLIGSALVIPASIFVTKKAANQAAFIVIQFAKPLPLVVNIHVRYLAKENSLKALNKANKVQVFTVSSHLHTAAEHLEKMDDSLINTNEQISPSDNVAAQKSLLRNLFTKKSI